MQQTISFEMAQKLDNAGFRQESELHYVYHVLSKSANTSIGNVRADLTWESLDPTMKVRGPLKRSELRLSDRFYDSWTDIAIPAYGINELLKYTTQEARLAVTTEDWIGSTAQLDNLAETLLNEINLQPIGIIKIDELDNYLLSEPIFFELLSNGTEFVLSSKLAGVSFGTEDNFKELLTDIKEMIGNHYHQLMVLPDEKLGPQMLINKKYLSNIMKPKP